MKRSPLQLVHSHFSALSLVAIDLDPESEEGEQLYPDVPEDVLETTIELGLPTSAGADPSHFLVKIGVMTRNELPKGFPYRLATQIEGVFVIDDDSDIDVRKRLVVINGGSMLFGIVREQVLALSLRHKNGPLLLPSLDFRGLGPAADERPSKSAARGKRGGAVKNGGSKATAT